MRDWDRAFILSSLERHCQRLAVHTINTLPLTVIPLSLLWCIPHGLQSNTKTTSTDRYSPLIEKPHGITHELTSTSFCSAIKIDSFLNPFPSLYSVHIPRSSKVRLRYISNVAKRNERHLLPVLPSLISIHPSGHIFLPGTSGASGHSPMPSLDLKKRKEKERKGKERMRGYLPTYRPPEECKDCMWHCERASE